MQTKERKLDLEREKEERKVEAWRKKEKNRIKKKEGNDKR